MPSGDAVSRQTTNLLNVLIHQDKVQFRLSAPRLFVVMLTLLRGNMMNQMTYFLNGNIFKSNISCQTLRA